MIRFSCNDCGKELKVKDELAGRKGRCPQCKTVLAIPASQTPPDRSGRLATAAKTGEPIQARAKCKIGQASRSAIVTFDSVGFTAVTKRGEPICKFAWAEIDEVARRGDKFGASIDITKADDETITLVLSKGSFADDLFREARSAFDGLAMFTQLEMSHLKTAVILYVVTFFLSGTAFLMCYNIFQAEKIGGVIELPEALMAIYKVMGVYGMFIVGLSIFIAGFATASYHVLEHFMMRRRERQENIYDQ